MLVRIYQHNIYLIVIAFAVLWHVFRLDYAFRLKTELMQQKAKLIQQSDTNSRLENEVTRLLKENQDVRNQHSEAVSRLKSEVMQLLQENQKLQVKVTAMEKERQRINDMAQALRLNSEDNTGLIDYALESSGAYVLSTGYTEPYGSCIKLLGITAWYKISPNVILRPNVSHGNCWAFQGNKGSVTIQLAATIKPTEVSMEHIPKWMSPAGKIDSAPREFSVYGMDDPNDTLGTLLGKFTYDQDGTAIQTFSIQAQDVKDYGIIQMRVESNWGNPDYTCIYRFRVHGNLLKQSLSS